MPKLHTKWELPNGGFLLWSFLLHSLFGILLSKGFFFSHMYLYTFLFVLVESKISLLFIECQLFIFNIYLKLQLSQIWSVKTPLSLDIVSSCFFSPFLEYFFIFWPNKVFLALLVLFLHQTREVLVLLLLLFRVISRQQDLRVCCVTSVTLSRLTKEMYVCV